MIRIFDRLHNSYVDLKRLPERVELGRYMIRNDEDVLELPQELRVLSCHIEQELFLPIGQHLHPIFMEFKALLDAGKLEVRPIIPRTHIEIKMRAFEKSLRNDFSHIEQIFRKPHSLLSRNVEKVNVALARKIPARSYEYAASHSEDWQAKNLVTFKPSKILHEYLEQNFDVYENQLLLAFVERTVDHLYNRLHEVGELESFYDLFVGMLQDTHKNQYWYQCLTRSMKLVGDNTSQSDQHDREAAKQREELKLILDQLTFLRNRLLQLRQTSLELSTVNSRTIQNLYPRNTNVIVNHRHYRYLGSLCKTFIKEEVKAETSEEKLQNDQAVLHGFRAYGRYLVSYVIREYLGYELTGSLDHLRASHPHGVWPDLDIMYDNVTQVTAIKAGALRLRIVFLAGRIFEETKYIIPEDTIVLYLHNDGVNVPGNYKGERYIPVSPSKIFATEELAGSIKAWLIREKCRELLVPKRFRPSLLKYIEDLDLPFIELDTKTYNFLMVGWPQPLLWEKVKSKLKLNESDKTGVAEGMKGFVTEINNLSNKLLNSYLKCPNCFHAYGSFEVSRLDYLKCSNKECETIMIVRDQKVIVKVSRPDLPETAYGMDVFEVLLN